jgi:hypothetical protein
MSTLVDRSGRAPAPGVRARPGSRGPGRSQLIAGALVAAQAAAASLALILVPVVLAWATASYSRAPWGQAVQVGVAAWLLAHHGGIVIPGGHVGLMPIGMMLIPLTNCWFAGVRLARGLDPNAEAIRAGIGRARPVLPPTRALLALILSYSALVTLVGSLATTAAVRPVVVQAFVGAALISAVGGVTGAAAWRAGGLRPGLRLASARLRLPVEVVRCLRPTALAVLIQLGGALVIFLAALVIGWDRVLGLHHALQPGIVGGLILLVGQLVVVPNLVVWSGAYAAGPGFAVGTGTSVSPEHTHLGALPAVPVLGVLPTPGEVPGWAWAVLALPVLAGMAAGWLIVRRNRGETVQTLLDALLTAVLAGVCWAVLGWLSGGPAGPGRLAQFGPSGWRLGLAVTAEVGAGVLLAVGLGLAVHYLSAPRPLAPGPADPAAPRDTGFPPGWI